MFVNCTKTKDILRRGGDNNNRLRHDKAGVNGKMGKRGTRHGSSLLDLLVGHAHSAASGKDCLDVYRPFEEEMLRVSKVKSHGY